MKYTRPLAGLTWAYLALLFTWLAAYLASGDRSGYLGLFNLLAVYLFCPLPLAILAAALARSRSLWIACGLGLLAFLALWGGYFFPKRPPVTAGQPTLAVMTFNVLAWHDFTQPVIATIRAEDPDVVLLQELNHGLARRLETDLLEIYPYQVLAAVDNPNGIGVLSKFPIRDTGDRLPDAWIGGPLLLEMNWNGATVYVVNFHMYPTTRLASQATIQRDFDRRAAQAAKLVGYARGRGAVILGGDANSTPLSDAHRIFTTELHDAWRVAGFGLGHTFPGSTIPGSDRPKIGPWYVPPWLARIDYIFYTHEWTAVSTRLARIDGVSDHRGVVAILQLRPK